MEASWSDWSDFEEDICDCGAQLQSSRHCVNKADVNSKGRKLQTKIPDLQ